MGKEVPQSEEPLIIDYGTSYTTAGTYFQAANQASGEKILFPIVSGCEAKQQGSCRSCALCPSVIAVKDCSDGIAEHMTFLYGEEAVQEEKNKRFLAAQQYFLRYETLGRALQRAHSGHRP